MSNPNPPSGGPPLRALAMVLIALAIVFAGLGAMSLSSSESSGEDVSAEEQSTQEHSTQEQSSESPSSESQTQGQPTTAAATTPQAAPPPTTTGADKAVPVRVLNNSTVSGLAAQTANQLTAEGWDIAETGNYPGGVVPATTVYYGDSPDEQAAAQQIAGTLGVSAQPRFSGIASSQPGVIVIVTGN